MSYATPVPQSAHPSALHRVFIAAWLAVGLGIVVQTIVIAGRIFAGASPTMLQVLATLAGGVTWSTIVCGGLALGLAGAKHQCALMGVLGALCSPVAFAAAKGVNRGLQSLAAPALDLAGALAVAMGAVKTVEYALLGLALGLLVSSSRSTLSRHLLVGAGTGLVFGSINWLLEAGAATGALPAAKLVAIVLNEYAFPIGCSLVIYIAANVSTLRSEPLLQP